MTIFRIPIFLLTIVHDGNWKINAEICSIFADSFDIFVAKERENVSLWNILLKVPVRRTLFGVQMAGRRRRSSGKRYILRLQISKSFVICEQNRFPCGKERVFPEKMKIPPCLLVLVVLVCISVKIGCFGGFCRKSSLFQTRNEMVFTVFDFWILTKGALAKGLTLVQNTQGSRAYLPAKDRCARHTIKIHFGGIYKWQEKFSLSRLCCVMQTSP